MKTELDIDMAAVENLLQKAVEQGVLKELKATEVALNLYASGNPDNPQIKVGASCRHGEAVNQIGSEDWRKDSKTYRLKDWLVEAVGDLISGDEIFAAVSDIRAALKKLERDHAEHLE